MARSTNNVLTRNYSGKVAGQYVLRTRGNKSIIAGLPAKNERVASPKQEIIRRKFALSVIYAKKALTNPELKAAYNAVTKGNQTSFNVALLDAFRAPEISNFRSEGFTGAAGQFLIVQAIDNFRVTRVSFGLYAPDGTLLEEGDAIMDENGYDWIYTTKSEIPSTAGTHIRISAEDIPKNRTLLEVVI
jgi:hypothetical protein